MVVDVPLTTTLADLDEAIRRLLKRELARHGFENVDISFDAPARDWSGKLTGPTVNLFLYDLREAAQGGEMGMRERRANGEARLTPPPLRLEVTYAITAWTKAIEDEHRLLSQILAILHSYQSFPSDVLEGRSASLGAIETSLGRPMEEKADFWSAVGGQYKPAVDYAITLTLESGAYELRGPPVRTQVLRTQVKDGPRRTMVEMTRWGGTVVDGEGAPVADAWVAIPALGMLASSDSDGRFIFDRVQAGEYKLVARSRAGQQVEVTARVPGTTDVVLKAGKK